MSRSTFADRFKKAKQASGKTLEELAQDVGLSSRQALNGRLRGPTYSTEFVQRLAKALGCSPEWLAYGHKCKL